ncbi:MAG: hypothetical protein KY469_08880 [Actinobacteria bacterium]|nr:hypothetical protein [Actinomycetota bacterium]
MAASQRIDRGLGVGDAPRARSLATPRLVGAGLAAWLVLFGAVQVGLSTPDRELLSGESGAVALDYSALRGTIAQLTEAFIAEVLGLVPAPTTDDTADPARDIASPAAPISAEQTPLDAPPAGRIEVTHPPDNDTFAEAYEVPSVPFTARTDARSASRQPGEPSSCAPAGPTLWYRYSPERTTGLVASTEGTSSATSLGVFTGSGLDDLHRVGCDTDLVGDAHVAFESVAGSDYYFQVGRPAGGGSTVFTLDAAGVTERVSLNSEGEEIGAARYWMGATSADGRFVAFQSLSSQLVPGDTNAAWDVFVKDRLTGAVERVSEASDGTEGNDHSGGSPVDISADGRFVAFYSWADNLVPDDTNKEHDAFVHDRLTRETTRVSVSSSGRQGRRFATVHALLTPFRADCQHRPRDAPVGGHQHQPCIEWVAQLSITADGCVVVFESAMLGLIEGEDQEAAVVDARFNPPYQVYAHDRCVRETTRVSVDAAGEPGNGASSGPAVSADGRLVVFKSVASNLVPGIDPGETFQLFLADRVTGEMRFVSSSVNGGGPSNGHVFAPDISGDGRVVVFASLASDLVAEDRNEITDIFGYDVASGSLEVVSVNSDGEQQQVERDATERAGVGEFYALVSDDGRYVAFESPADNLSARDEARAAVPTATGCFDDVYLRDRHAGTTLLVSVNSRGEQANNCSSLGGLSPSGAEVVFLSSADNLVDDDTNGGRDLFVHSLGGVS